MNEKIVQQLVKLHVDYKKSWHDFGMKDNDYAVFRHEYQAYYQPLVDNILPQIKKQLNNSREEKLDSYLDYIKPEWKDLLIQDLKRNDVVGSQFLIKLSETLLSDFSHLLNAYKKTGADHLKNHFLHQFLTNKANSIAILLKNNPLLGINTIASLKSPKLQFSLINNNKVILEELKKYFSTASIMEISYALSEFCDYPSHPNVEQYYKEWIGGNFIHIKFCKLILQEKYESAKAFIKQKHEFN